jgi:hypothetical protein
VQNNWQQSYATGFHVLAASVAEVFSADGQLAVCYARTVKNIIRETPVMSTFIKRIQIGLLGMLAFGLCLADDLPYKEGTVTEVSSIRTKEGHFIDYMTFLNTSWRQEMEEAKKQGIIVSYSIFSATPRTPHDPDLYLIVEYPNLAALDNIDEKMGAIDKKIWGSLKQAAQSDAERDAIRTVLGTEIVRQLHFKN